MKEWKNTIIKGIGAGFVIAIGGTVYLSLENKIIGSLLFTIGLYTIVLNGLALYTGKVGYFIVEKQKKQYAGILLCTWSGNLIGTGIGAFLLLHTRAAFIAEKAKEICAIKAGDTPVSIFLLSIFCGILMYIAVDGYKQVQNPCILFLGVSVFILCGFEHCIANMFYFWLSGAWSAKMIGYLVLMTLGNSLGGMILPFLKSLDL